MEAATHEGQTATERRLKSAPLRELTPDELAEAHDRGFMSEELFRAETHRRRADALASPWERAREAARWAG